MHQFIMKSLDAFQTAFGCYVIGKLWCTTCSVAGGMIEESNKVITS
jgi:hypothetical protein